MLNLLENPLTLESRLAAVSLGGKSLSGRILRPRTAVRVSCTSSSSPASPSSIQRVAVNEVQRSSSAAEQRRRIGRRARSPKTATRAASLSSPLFWDDSQNGAPKRAQNGAAASRVPKVEVSAKGKWRKADDSSLSDDEPLPLPMTWPDSEPAPKEKIDQMLACDPEAQTCKSVIYQWTGDCKRCQGTGLISFYRKKHEVLGKCMNCLGIGSVHKITSRADIQDIYDTDGGSNGSANGSARTDGKA